MDTTTGCEKCSGHHWRYARCPSDPAPRAAWLSVHSLDAITQRWTAFDTFAEFVAAEYVPTMREDQGAEVTTLADAFDAARAKLGRPLSWRPYRGGVR